MLIECANIQGLSSNFSAVVARIEQTTPDLLFLTETQVSCNRPEFTAPRDYRLLSSFTKKHGVCVYISPRLSYARVIKHEINNKYFNSIFLRLSVNQSYLFVIGIYRSPNTPSNVDCFDPLSDSLCSLYSDFPEAQVIIVGDFNIHNSNWLRHSSHTDISGRSAELLASTFGLHQMVNEPTRKPRANQFANTLDLVLSSIPDYTSVSVSPQLGSSDHFLISVTLQVAPNLLSPPPPRSVFNFAKTNWPKLEDFYKTYPWRLILSCHDVNDAVESLVSAIYTGMRLHIPISLFGKHAKKIFSAKTKCALREKKAAYRKYNRIRSKNSHDPAVIEQASQELRQVSNRCKSIIKSEYFQFLKQKTDKVLSHPNDPRFYFHTVRSLQSNFVKSTTPPFDSNGTTICDPREKCNYLASIFASNSTIQEPSFCPPPLQRSNHTMRPITFRKNVVKRYLLELNPNKAAGPDNIPALILKRFAHIFAPILTRIFVLSYRTGKFPESWKIANVQPIPKKGDKSNALNYRPISIISVLSKTFEKYINWHMLNYAESVNILCDTQYGFRKGRSTCDILALLMHNWNKCLEQKEEAYAISLDIAKAFDSVWHSNLLHKIISYGFDPTLTILIRSFLHRRKISVVLDGYSSNLMELNAGVPQGSPLASTLFLIYINDLLSSTTNPIHSYADDTTLHAKVPYTDSVVNNHSSVNRKAVADSLSGDLKLIETWGVKNLVQFNASKTQLCQISRKACAVRMPILMDNRPLPASTSLHLLGITTSDSLSLNLHISSLAKATAQKLGFLARCRKFFSAVQCHRIYISFIRPCLEYCSPIWGGAPESQLSILDAIQRKAIRIINDPKITDSLPSLQHRRDVAELSLFFRYFSGNCSDELKSLLPSLKQFNRVSRNSVNSHPFVLEEKVCRTSHFQNDFFTRAVNKWNKLPIHIVSSTKVDIFKRKLHSYLLTHALPRLSSSYPG